MISFSLSGLLIIATLLVVGVFCQEDAVEESLEKVEEVAKNETQSRKERSKLYLIPTIQY